MTLDEAIKHAEEVAKEQEELYRLCPASESMFYCDGTKDCKTLKNGKNKGCRKCAEEHQQLAEWLKDYQRILEERHFDDAKKHFEIICKLSQAYGFTYSFVEEKIKETEKALLEASPPQFCGDCISREETLKALMDEWTEFDSELIDSLIGKIKKLPPVTPQPKMGRWVLKKDIDGKTYGVCSECGGIQYAGYLNYCPYCGARMSNYNKWRKNERKS